MAALPLILLSALLHATWNLLAKRARGGDGFTWLSVTSAALIATPLAVWPAHQSGLSLFDPVILFPLVSGLLHVGYFTTLNLAYRHGDLSLVYPLARGSGPLLAAGVAVIALGERPSPLGYAGIGAMTLGVLCLTLERSRAVRDQRATAVAYAISTGAFIATYTIWDKLAVSQAGLPPVVQFWGTMVTCAAVLTPWTFRSGQGVGAALRGQWLWGILAGAFIAAAYILILTAMVTAQVTVVAPAREIGILFGAIMGHRLLAEGHARQRLAGAALMVLGLTALAGG